MNTNENKHQLDDELGIKQDLQEDQSNLAKERLNIILMAALLLAFVGYMIYSLIQPKEAKVETKDGPLVNIQKKKFLPPPPPPTPPVVKKEEVKELPMSPFSPPEKKKVPLHVDKGARGSLITFNTNTQKESKKEESDPNKFDINFYNKALLQGTQNIKKATSSAKKKPSIYRGGDYAIAGVSRQNPNLSLAKGAYIECTMVTRIVSSYSGNTKCITSEDIYSTNGVTLLMEKGSTVTGHFKGGSLENGIERLFVIWDEIRTPNNVVVNIDSQATGKLGATGVDGYVDNHWAMRFGAAVLVSILDIGAESIKAKYTNGDNSNVNFGQSASPIQNMANTALAQFINIKPTFYKNHGDVVGIYVEKDLDFSKVYRLK